MQKKWKKILTFALVLTMLIPAGSSALSVAADDDTVTDTAADATTDDASGDDDDGGKADLIDKMTDEEALKFCEQIAKNDKFVLYYDDGDREDKAAKNSAASKLCLCVLDKNGDITTPDGDKVSKCWWTAPINAFGDDTIINQAKNSTMKEAQRRQISSNLVLTYAELSQDKRTTKDVYSAAKNATTEKSKKIKNGVQITYNFKKPGITIPVTYVLEDDGLRVSVDTTAIVEKNTSTEDGIVTTNIALTPQFGAAPATDLDGNMVEGYMIVPDGSGAVINYNNGKSVYNVYNQKIYGRDYTTVPLTSPKVIEQAYMPVMATVSGNDALVMIADKGDANANACAQVCGQSNQSYNTAYFSFELRSTDTYYMSGDAGNKLTVFEKGSIGTPEISVLYIPIEKDGGVNYADVAEVYRNYLIDDGLETIVEDGQYNFYLDLYGGVMKKRSILGVPVSLKTAMTSFDDAQEIIKEFTAQGVEDMVIGYNDWTNKLIKENISTKFKPSGTLGGSGDFKDLQKYVDSVDAELYPTMDNLTMNSSTLGYWTLTETAIRVSNAYSRQSSYSIAFGYEEKGVSPALLTPNTYGKVFGEILDSFNDKGQKYVSYGEYSTALVSDFLKKDKSVRNTTMETIVKGYEEATNGGIDKILCDGANAYVIKYASHITDVPIYSSGFNITDYDIPFYQMVVHGYVPYSSTSINKSSDAQEAFLLSIAYGAGLHYDMIYEDAQEISDTDYDDLYYAYYDAWLSKAAAQNAVAKEALSRVATMTISSFNRDGNVLTTTYSGSGSSDVTIVVDLDNATVAVDGVSLDMSEIDKTGGLLG